MSFELKLDDAPAGYALHDSIDGQPGEVELSVREFISSDEGEYFIARLEGFPAQLLSKLSVKILPSQIDNMLAIINKDLSCRVFINELKIIAKIQPILNIKAGQEVREDEIADIAELQLEGVEIPNDAALLFLFSVNWRKGLFFDFSPILPNRSPRSYSLSKTLGGFYAYLLNRSVFSLGENEWRILLENDWFPFVSLPKALLKFMAIRAKDSRTIDAIVPEVSVAVHKAIPQMLDRWATLAEYSSHIELIKHAASRYLENDFISSVAIIFPRIEGILRNVYSKGTYTSKPNQSRLAGSLLDIGCSELQPYSWLLPERFSQYLKESYFADFDSDISPRLSRHSIGHGVANIADFNEKHATIGFLILDQIFFLIKRANT